MGIISISTWFPSFKGDGYRRRSDQAKCLKLYLFNLMNRSFFELWHDFKVQKRLYQQFILPVLKIALQVNFHFSF